MKIKTEYDLMNRIKHFKNGVSGNDIFFTAIKRNIPLHIAHFSFFIYSLISKFTPIIIGTSTLYTIAFCLCNCIASKFKQRSKSVAEIDLQKLVNELSKLEVKTSMELLQESKINQIDYKIEYKDSDKIPKLRQYKYIDIPLSNGYEETILQEHSFIDKDYELSVNSPVKKYKYKTVKNNI